MNTTDARTTEHRSPGQWTWLTQREPHTYAVTFWLLSLLFFRQSLGRLASLSFNDELASHVLLIPLISAFLLYLERKRIFRTPCYCPSIGVPLLLAAVVLWFSLKISLSSLNNTDHLSVVAALIVLVWIAGFILFYGTASLKAAVFPLLFLLLMIPLPVVMAEHIISVLQKGSAGACYALFRLMGVPVIQHGFRFSLPGVEIEVAEQCSGIHSGLSLFIAGLLAEHLFLRGAWKKACFTFCILPIAIFKNAVRIVTICWLGIYVNPDFLHGALHRQGGLPFSFLALALMFLLLCLLRHPFARSRVRHPFRRLDSGIA
jgi:exosortase